MKLRPHQVVLMALICILAAALGVLVFLLESRESTPVLSGPVPSQTAAATQPATETTAVSVTEATPEATTAPAAAQPATFTLSFAGDCTFANVNGREGAKEFMSVIGTDYSYPFADVADYFKNDDCTFVNLECVLTDRDTPRDKLYIYRGKPEYTAILTQGSVEFAGIANNHSYDYGLLGYEDTAAALEAAGIHYARQGFTTVFTTESGLTIGVYSDDFSEGLPISPSRVKQKISQLKEQGAELIIANLHWGINYYYVPNDDQISLAHTAVNAGADIVFGHHSHVLQPVEEYNGGIIYYSLGNFSYGGNKNPPDKDTAILQQQVIRNADGSIELGKLTVIPCYVSGIVSYGNDFQPCPMEEGTKEYDRVLEKLSGNYDQEYLYVSYRTDLYPQ